MVNSKTSETANFNTQFANQNRPNKRGLNENNNNEINKKSRQEPDISATEILKYLQTSGTINIEKIKQKMKQASSPTNSTCSTPRKKDEDEKNKQNKDNDGSRRRLTSFQTAKNNENILKSLMSIEQPTNEILVNNSQANKAQTDGPKLEKLVTIRFEGSDIGKFRNYNNLRNELNRCNQSDTIKSAYINTRNQLIIKTTENMIEKLDNGWIKDAFMSGITKIGSKKNYYAAMYHVDQEFDIEDEELQKELKDKYDIVKATRIIKKSNKEPLTTVKLTFANEDNYNRVLKNGLALGPTFFRIKEWKADLEFKQCYKCLKLGHQQYTCHSEKKVCLRCGEVHEKHYSECDKPLKCANCFGNHAACSKSCPSILTYLKNKKKTSSENSKTPKKQFNNEEQGKYTQSHQQLYTHQLQQVASIQTCINHNNKATVAFIIEMLSCLNEVVNSIYEKPELVLNIVSKHFNPQITTSVKETLSQYIYLENSVSEESINIDENSDHEND
jgi:hypothetical protein